MRLKVPRINDNEIIMDAAATPIGWMGFALTNKGLIATSYGYQNKADAISGLKNQKILEHFSVSENEENFSSLLGQWIQFLSGLFTRNPVEENKPDVPIDDSGWTDFAKKVYYFLMKLPAGGIVSYGEVAAAVGSPGASRAVGSLMKNNPIAPLVPCHRVIGSGGKIGGFSAPGGIETKKILLKREGIEL